MAATRQKMEANGDITIYADAVAKLDEPEAPVEGMPPGLPEGTFPGNAPPGQPAGGSDQPVKTLNF